MEMCSPCVNCVKIEKQAFPLFLKSQWIKCSLCILIPLLPFDTFYLRLRVNLFQKFTENK